MSSNVKETLIRIDVDWLQPQLNQRYILEKNPLIKAMYDTTQKSIVLYYEKGVTWMTGKDAKQILQQYEKQIINRQRI